MIVTLTGARKLDFTSSDGKGIKGCQLFVRFPEEGVVGEMVDKLFLREDFPLPADCKPGCMLDIAFNRKGKPETIKVVPAK